MHGIFLLFFQFKSQCEIGPAFCGHAFSTPASSVLLFPVLHFRVQHFLVEHFPGLHFLTLETWSLIFQSCRSVFDLLGPSLVLQFPVLHFHSTLANKNVLPRCIVCNAVATNGPSVCTSVRLSNAWIVTKRKERLPTFLYNNERSMHLVLRHEEPLVGGVPFYLKFWA